MPQKAIVHLLHKLALTMHVKVMPAAFQAAGGTIIHMSPALSSMTRSRRFRAAFGTSPRVCSVLWSKCHESFDIPVNALPVHLLWVLLFLKLYASEQVNAALTKSDEKTFRKWSWLFIEALASIDDLVSRFIVAIACCCCY